MNQVLPLSRRLCARNAGIGIILSVLVGFFVYFSLDTIFAVPGEAALAAVNRI